MSRQYHHLLGPLSSSNAMNVGFTSFDVLNTSVIDETKECLLFEVSTPKCGHPPTTIKNAAGEVIGEYEPKFPKAKITLNGYTTALSEWLPKKNPMATERILTLPNGKVYIWKQKWTGSFKASLGSLSACTSRVLKSPARS
ncbi:hypothetical protein L227DRAFT_56855 [Lentinus tigrinus ALCF2SS1-6]|uniref:DUF6593 domain-containing protein n=1 Tax=Lentinus tigrinus ALCF2SS1-6 TaxID=1328759 RepID=A0A5C2SD64_9APHY|nr:hypothetical protein L227DRAFT_56855 [Lentinus tigrinus ALCF2SS1-6]